MRKNAKERKASKTTIVSDNNEMGKLIKIVIVVAIVYLVFYLITIAVQNKKEATTPVEIQYTEILVGSILNRPIEEYLVLVTKEDDENLSTYEQLLTAYNKKETHLTVYKSDLSDGFNSKYVGEKNNLLVSDINQIKFNTSALLRIKNQKVVEALTDVDKIKEYLK